MGISITINGGPGPEGFLVAPSGGQQFPAQIGLKTDDGSTVQATFTATTPAGVSVQLGTAAAAVGPTQKIVRIGAKTPSFTKGDAAIGQKVELGPDSFLSSNRPANPQLPPPFENFGPGFEPIENFEPRVGTLFSGKPAALNDRPKASGFFALTPAQLTQYGIVAPGTFNTQRKAALLKAYQALPPAERTGTPAGRNLATRIPHLGGAPPDNIPPSQGTLPFGWSGQETYNGLVNSAVRIAPGARSPVMAYLKTFPSFRYSGRFFNFHSDELCGRVDGTLRAMTLALSRQQPRE